MSESISQKQCSRCKQWKPATTEFFHADKSTSDKLTCQCRECRVRHHPPANLPQQRKQCCQCKQWKPMTTEFFHADRSMSDGLRKKCRDCKNLTARHLVKDGYKRCTQCHQELLATHEYFTKSSTEKHGLCAVCRECRQQQNIESRIIGVLPSEGHLKQCSQCQQSKPATLDFFTSDQSKTDHLSTRCKECINSKRRAIVHTEAFYKKRRQQLRYYYRTKERERLQAHIRSTKRRCRKKNVSGKYKIEDIQMLYQQQEGKCRYCFAELDQTSYHIDHVIPLTHPGSSNDPWNLALACPSCNLSKGNKSLQEWLESKRLKGNK